MVEQTSLERLVGAAFGNYRLEQLIERNKWGPVFLAHTRAGSNCVLRFIDVPAANVRTELNPDARIVFLGRFQQEANQVAALRHPHILPLLDYGNYRGTPYLVYPHAPLVSVRTLLTQKALTDTASVGHYLDQIAAALEYAHEHAVLHRNLSTNCIYLHKNRQLAVAEFGLFRMVELGRQEMSVEENGAQQRPSFDGSSESCSPEQILGKAIDAHADIYSLGAVLYSLLTGHSPFTGKTREEVIRQHLYAQVPPISTWRSGLPVDLDHIIVKTMSKEPVQRYSSPMALAQAYRQIVAPGEEKQNSFDISMPMPAISKQPSAPLAVRKGWGGVWQRLSRRQLFTFVGVGGGITLVGLGALWGSHLFGGGKESAVPGVISTRTTVANVPAPGAKNILARVADLPTNSARTFPIANQQRPGVIIHLPDTRIVAYDSTCTHASCEVSYNPNDHLLECPCHGAVFDPAKNAAVLQGPAQTPLKQIKIAVNPDGTITTV